MENKIKEENTWFLWVWESEMDIMWSDIPKSILEKINEVNKQDKIRYVVDQSYWTLTHSCTMASPYSVLCSIFNKKVDQKEMEEIEELASNWSNPSYVRYKWWYTKDWVNRVTKYWNNKYKDMQCMYFRSTIWSDEWALALSKWLWVVVSRTIDKEYMSDRFDNWIVSWIHHWWYPWHVVSWYESNNWILILDQYPKRKYNSYIVKDIEKQWVYFPACYIIIPIQKKTKEDILLKKVIKKAMLYNKTIAKQLKDSWVNIVTKSLMDLYYKYI